MTPPPQTDRESGFPKALPCPHCGEPLSLQAGLPKLPIRCTKCLQYSVFPLESRVKAATLLLAIAVGTVLLIRTLSLDKASTFLGISGLVAVLVGGLLIGSRLVERSTRKTATHLVKSRRPFLWFR